MYVIFYMPTERNRARTAFLLSAVRVEPLKSQVESSVGTLSNESPGEMAMPHQAKLSSAAQNKPIDQQQKFAMWTKTLKGRTAETAELAV